MRIETGIRRLASPISVCVIAVEVATTPLVESKALPSWVARARVRFATRCTSVT